MKHARNCAKYAKTSVLISQYETGFSCPAADDVMGSASMTTYVRQQQKQLALSNKYKICVLCCLRALGNV